MIYRKPPMFAYHTAGAPLAAAKGATTVTPALTTSWALAGRCRCGRYGVGRISRLRRALRQIMARFSCVRTNRSRMGIVAMGSVIGRQLEGGSVLL